MVESAPDRSAMPFELAAEPSADLLLWAREQAVRVEDCVRRHGAVLIRGLDIAGSKTLARCLEILFGQELLEYTYRSTPRTRMRGNVYTSTEYDPSLPIVQHNENAYSNRWPMRIAFYCVQPASEGGATPIADSRVVYRLIPPSIRRELERRKLKYVRNYGLVDLPWEEVFQTSDRREVERYCAENDITCEWLGVGGLRTSQVTHASYYHPVTNDRVWFNQAHLFHDSNLRRELVDAGTAEAFDVETLPRNVYFGDGAPISDDMIETIEDVYARNSMRFDWRCGDLLILDNMLYSHGRETYRGARKILVGMSHPAGAQDVVPCAP